MEETEDTKNTSHPRQAEVRIEVLKCHEVVRKLETKLLLKRSVLEEGTHASIRHVLWENNEAIMLISSAGVGFVLSIFSNTWKGSKPNIIFAGNEYTSTNYKHLSEKTLDKTIRSKSPEASFIYYKAIRKCESKNKYSLINFKLLNFDRRRHSKNCVTG